MNNLGLTLDRQQNDRVGKIAAKIDDGDFHALDSLFLSERVNEEFDEDKVLLHSFDLDAILSYLPYSDKIYVSLCPACVTDSHFDKYKLLLSTNSIVPIFSSNYPDYDEKILEFTSSKNHICVQEYNVIRTLLAGEIGGSRLCSHCLKNRTKSIKSMISRRSSMVLPRKGLPIILSNLRPYVEPDFHLLDDFYAALKNRDSMAAREVVDLSWTVRNMRTAQVFRSPLILNGDKYSDLP